MPPGRCAGGRARWCRRARGAVGGVTSTRRGTQRRRFDAVVDTDGVARASRHTLLAQVATQASRLVVSVVLARLLTPSEFGVVAAAMVVMVVAWQLTDLGTAAVIIQRDVIDDALVSSVFWFNLALGGGALGPDRRRRRTARRRPRPARGRAGDPAAGGRLVPRRARQHAPRPAAPHHAVRPARHDHDRQRRRQRHPRHRARASPVPGIWALVVGTVAGVAASTATAWWFEQLATPRDVFSLRRLREVARFSIHFFWSNALAVIFAPARQGHHQPDARRRAARHLHRRAAHGAVTGPGRQRGGLDGQLLRLLARPGRPGAAALRRQPRGRRRHAGRAAGDGRPRRPRRAGRGRGLRTAVGGGRAGRPGARAGGRRAGARVRHRLGDAGDGPQRLALPLGAGQLPASAPRPWCSARSGAWSG